MTREEEIKNAAKAYISGDILSSPSILIHFANGAGWADLHPNLERLWHDASEEPQYKNKRILCYSEYFDFFNIDFPSYLMILYGGQNDDWETVVLRKKISKWAYVSDLLPKGGKK